MIQKMQQTLNTVQNVKDTSLKHILKFLKKYDIHVKDNVI